MTEVIKIRIKRFSNQRAMTLYPNEPAAVGLDGVQVGLRFRHHAAENRWYMWLVSLDGIEFAGPLKLVSGLDLFLPYKYDERVPKGQLFVRGGEADKDTIDDTSLLCYRRVADVTEATPGANL